MVTYYEPKKLSPAELAELHALPDAALVTAQEAAAFLRLKYHTMAWYRCNGGGPKFTRLGPKMIRYRMGDLRDYAKGQPMSEGVRKVAAAMLAGRTAKLEG
ncbi:TPA: DNA-binding protein [Pseudomonas aeruginosa]|nr:helix-turn-helix domain-containing protein [Pseudomonas aeruginosa]MDV6687940.1 helix-turn-helix domain-containing protein [Pseudomonas aeruginosa]HCL3865655.1 DNA-binding protein [Pseudomonas aeruginosa]